MTAPNGGAEAALEASDEQGRAECVDVAGRVHRRTKHTGGRADGDGGERLYTWMAGNGPDSQIDVAMRRALDASVGAAVIGRRTLDLGVGPGAARRGPVCPALWSRIGRCLDPLGDNGGTFAFDGLQAAVQRAEQAAGDNDVLVLGVDVARQLLTAAVLGELRLHLVPLLLGAGTPLFEGGSRPN